VGSVGSPGIESEFKGTWDGMNEGEDVSSGGACEGRQDDPPADEVVSIGRSLLMTC